VVAFPFGESGLSEVLATSKFGKETERVAGIEVEAIIAGVGEEVVASHGAEVQPTEAGWAVEIVPARIVVLVLTGPPIVQSLGLFVS